MSNGIHIEGAQAFTIGGTFHNGLRSCIERKLRRKTFQTKAQATRELKKITEECKKRRPERR